MSEIEALRVPLARRAQCELCGEQLDVAYHGNYQYAAGWVSLRSKGANAVADAIRYNRWAHGECVRRAIAGRESQGTLF